MEKSGTKSLPVPAVQDQASGGALMSSHQNKNHVSVVSLEPGTGHVPMSELEQQVLVARRYPRDIRKVRSVLIVMASLDEESAAEMMYCLPQGGSKVEGASIRLAEAIAQAWGNNRHSSRVVEVNRGEKYVEAEGTFLDLETNMATTALARRRIFDKYGKIYSEDQILKTGSAACSIARRNAILSGVPKAVYRAAYDEAQRVIAGKPEELPRRRAEALNTFTKSGIAAAQVFRAIGVQSEREISSAHIVTLRGMWSALKNGEATKEEMFAFDDRPASGAAKRKTLDDIAQVSASTVEQRETDTRDEGAIFAADQRGYQDFARNVQQIPASLKTAGGAVADAWFAGWDRAAAEAAIAQKNPPADSSAPAALEEELPAGNVPRRTAGSSPQSQAYIRGREDFRKGITLRGIPAGYASDPKGTADWKRGWNDESKEQQSMRNQAAAA